MEFQEREREGVRELERETEAERDRESEGERAQWYRKQVVWRAVMKVPQPEFTTLPINLQRIK